MANNESEEGVYGLVTKLCETQLIKHNKRLTTDAVKKLRCKTFEALLTNKTQQYDDPMWLANCTDYHCQFLAWEFMLQSDFNMREEAEDIDRCVKQLLNTKQDHIENVLHFLLRFKQLPKMKPIVEGHLSVEPSCVYRTFVPSDFQLNEHFLCKNAKYSNQSFHLPIKAKVSLCPMPKMPSNTSCLYMSSSSASSDWITFDEGYESPSSNISIWDTIMQTKFTSRRTWETYGNPAPEKELPFCSETNTTTYSLLDRMDVIKKLCIVNQEKGQLKVLSKKELFKDLKYVLVGVASNTFQRVGNRFRVNPRVIFEGFSKVAFDQFCNLMMICGSCYSALSQLVTEKNPTKYGIIFTELCSAIDRYLLFYRVAALKCPDTSGLFQFHALIRNLSQHLLEVAALCKVGPYEDAQHSIPTGMELLNYLYEIIFRQVDRKVVMVLYALLYPCLQVYFMRFLRPWLIDGQVNDPFNEFFIRTTHKYLASRGRTYWTRSFTICDEMVPMFLHDFKHEIYTSGKTMNMLKLCVPKSCICTYLMSKKPNLVQCCITPQQLSKLESCVRCYQLEIHALQGPFFSMRHLLALQEDEKLIFSKLVVAKRAATFKRIEQNKLEKAEKLAEAKREQMKVLRVEYERAVAEKEARKRAELERELKENEKSLKMREIADRIRKEEAEKIIAHYSRLSLKADKLNASIETHMKSIKDIHLMDYQAAHQHSDAMNANTTNTEVSNTCDNDVQQEINSNITDVTGKLHPESNSDDVRVAYEERNRIRQQAKEKYMREELGVDTQLTSLQINKNKIMGTSLGFIKKDKNKRLSAQLGNNPEQLKTQRQINKEHNLKSSWSFDWGSWIDDNNDVNENRPTSMESQENNNNPSAGETIALSPDAEDNQEDKPVVPDEPSTSQQIPIELNLNDLNYESRFTSWMKTPNFEFPKSDSLFTTPASALSIATTPMIDESVRVPQLDLDFSKRVTIAEVKNVHIQFLDHCIRNSISMPLEVQNSLIKKELLQYFIVELKFLDHLEYLRNYYFLLDGEYSRNITEELFYTLYVAETPTELLNLRMLKRIISLGLDSSLKPVMENQRVSFLINSVPKVFDLGDVDVLDCISLSYEVKWPLNVLLPTDTIAKYDEIFRFLLKVNRVAFVLKNIFMDMRMLSKTIGRSSGLLMLSNQYQALQLYRHIMTHFVQTFQNYIVGEVLHSSWAELQAALSNVYTLDELYTSHTAYVKKIYFLCLLNQKSIPIRKVIVNVFTVILKFYDYMRSGEWIFEDNEYVHPNFYKLQDIFFNFMDLAKYFFKVGEKVARAAYQPQFAQLVDLLNVNNYYTKDFRKVANRKRRN